MWKVTHLSSIPQTFPFRAVSNTFDYTVTLEGGPGDPDTILRGVEERADVGLLSLFEHYQSTTVGEHLKTPAFPVWLVCSESHFSVLWRVRHMSLFRPSTVMSMDVNHVIHNRDNRERVVV